jgi:hypothetical protein
MEWVYTNEVDICFINLSLREETYQKANDLGVIFSDKTCFAKVNEEKFGKHIAHPSPTPPII